MYSSFNVQQNIERKSVVLYQRLTGDQEYFIMSEERNMFDAEMIHQTLKFFRTKQPYKTEWLIQFHYIYPGKVASGWSAIAQFAVEHI